MIIHPNSNGAPEEEGEILKEKWSDAARAAAAAGRKGKGQGFRARQILARRAFRASGGRRTFGGAKQVNMKIPVAKLTQEYISSLPVKPKKTRRPKFKGYSNQWPTGTPWGSQGYR